MHPVFGNPRRIGLLSAASELLHEKTEWSGGAGRSYQAYVYKLGEELPLFGGVYVWVRVGQTLIATRLKIALYAGRAGDFRDRMQKHQSKNDKWPDALRLGMTEIHLIPIFGDESLREKVESDLINHHRPPLNEVIPPLPYFGPATILGGGYR